MVKVPIVQIVYCIWVHLGFTKAKSICIRVCRKINFFEFLAPILVCHGERYQKVSKKVSGPNMTISESASHFCKYKGNYKDTKENIV